MNGAPARRYGRSSTEVDGEGGSLPERPPGPVAACSSSRTTSQGRKSTGGRKSSPVATRRPATSARRAPKVVPRTRKEPSIAHQEAVRNAIRSRSRSTTMRGGDALHPSRRQPRSDPFARGRARPRTRTAGRGSRRASWRRQGDGRALRLAIAFASGSRDLVEDHPPHRHARGEDLTQVPRRWTRPRGPRRWRDRARWRRRGGASAGDLLRFPRLTT